MTIEKIIELRIKQSELWQRFIEQQAREKELAAERLAIRKGQA